MSVIVKDGPMWDMTQEIKNRIKNNNTQKTEQEQKEYDKANRQVEEELDLLVS